MHCCWPVSGSWILKQAGLSKHIMWQKKTSSPSTQFLHILANSVVASQENEPAYVCGWKLAEYATNGPPRAVS